MRRQKIVDALVLKMATIKTTNDFLTNIGENCFEWYEKRLDEKQYPAVIIRDTDSDCKDSSSNTFEHTLKIEIDIATKGKKPMVDMRKAMADVLKAFGSFQSESSRVCQYKGSESLIDQKDYTYGGTRLVFFVEYQAPEWEM